MHCPRAAVTPRILRRAGYVDLRVEHGAVLIAQITDTHITRSGPQAGFLADVIARIATMEPRPDVVLHSGDAADTGAHEQYARLREILERSPVPVMLVPGNHDVRAALRAELPAAYYPGADGERVRFAVDSLPVRLIGLDTSMPRRPGGMLDSGDLDWLDATLGAAPERPALLFMHHPPFRTGVNAADMFGFIGRRRLAAIVARHRAVRRIIAGHIHCERHATIAHAQATSSISTAPQHVPELFERRILALRGEPAGFAVHAFTNGRFTSKTYINTGAGRFLERVNADERR